jgi:hypothetical protein
MLMHTKTVVDTVHVDFPSAIPVVFHINWARWHSDEGDSIPTFGLYGQTPTYDIAVVMDFLEDVASGGTTWIN